MKYYVANFQIKDAPSIGDCRDLLATMASEAGFESFEETDEGLNGYVQQSMLDESKLRELLGDFPIEGVKISYTLSQVEDKDWNEQWENEGFEPIVVGDRCVIHDTKHQADAALTGRKDLLDITIEAKQAFGTGTHETTRLIVGQLLQMDLKGKRVLDCGCGTGILGIVASKMGAQSVVGYDIDEWSVENARHNAELNGVQNMEVLEGNQSVLSHVSGIFDVVLANINRNVLMADMPAMKEVMSHEGILILSGFYAEDGIMIAEKAGSLGLSLSKTSSENNWCMLLFNA